MSEKTVLLKLGIQPVSGGNDPLVKMTKDAKDAEKAVSGLSKGVGQMAHGSVTLKDESGKVLFNFSGMGKELEKASKQADKMQKSLEKAKTDSAKIKDGASGGERSFGSLLWRGQGEMANKGTSEVLAKTLGGEGGLRMMLARTGIGGLGGLALAGGSNLLTAGIRSNAGVGQGNLISQQLQKGDLGILERAYYGGKDFLSGREYRERIQTERNQRGLEAEQLRSGDRGARYNAQSSQLDLAMFAGGLSSSMAYNAYGPQEPAAASRLQLERLGVQRRVAEGRIGEAGGEIKGAYREEFAAAQQYNKGDPKDRLKALGDQAVALEKQRALYQQQAQDAAKIVEIDKQRVQLADQMVAGMREQVKGMRDQFAALDPMQRERAIFLGGRIKKGEKLEGAELEEANQFNLLQPLVQAQRAQEVDKSGDFARLIQAIGDDRMKAAADKAIQNLKVEGGEIRVEMNFDEAKLADEFVKRGFDFIDRVKVEIDKAEQRINQRMQQNGERQQAQRNAARG